MKVPLPRRPVAVAGGIVGILFVLLLLLFVEDKLHHTVDFEPDSVNELSDEELQTGKAIEQYNRWTLSENRRIFQWHARSTKVLFWVSILITITGMSFAFWQFVEASQSEKAAIETEELQVKTQLVSLAFKSRSLATFMMFVSLAYLLIYVTMVYPVKPVDADAVGDGQPQSVSAPQGLDPTLDSLSPSFAEGETTDE